VEKSGVLLEKNVEMLITTTNLFAADKYISIIDIFIYINYTAAGCQGAIQLSMLAAYNFNNNVLS